MNNIPTIDGKMISDLLKGAFFILAFSVSTISSSCKEEAFSKEQKQTYSDRGLPGNNVVQFLSDKGDKTMFTDPIDDTIHFKKIIGNIYKDNSAKYYLRTQCFRPYNSDTLLTMEYFKDVSDFIDIKSYKEIGEDYFLNKGKVYIWWGNSDGEYPIEVVSADPKTFIPFKKVAGGSDKNYVFYGGPPGDFEIIKDANPKTLRILNPERGCWNCGTCYFADDKNVFFGLNKIEGADANTFKLLNNDSVDAEDRFGKYFDGKLIKKK